jgi:hypothetical protein
MHPMNPPGPSARLRQLLLAALLPCCALLIVLLVGYTAQSSAAHPALASHPALTPPGGYATQPTGPAPTLGPYIPHGTPYPGPYGIPAIQPEAALATSSGPHFTAADVEQYIAANPPPFAVKGTPTPTVVSVTFEPASELSPAYGSLSGTTPSTPICIVMVSGTFLNTWGGPYGVTITATPFHQGFMIFDGDTGYLLADNLG